MHAGVRRAVLTALLLALGCALVPSIAAASSQWGRPFQIVAPKGVDLLGAQLAFAADDATAVGYGTTDPESPADSVAALVTGARRGALGAPRPIAGAQQILALAYLRNSLELVTGSSTDALACCSSAAAEAIGPGGAVTSDGTLLSRLAGATAVQLVALHDRLLAAIATEDGIWTAVSSRSGGFPTATELAPAGAVPPLLAATSTGGDGSLVAYTTTVRGTIEPEAAEEIVVASSSGSSPPRHPRIVMIGPAGHSIDSLALAPDRSGTTLAWTESWVDAAGAFHSEAFAADVVARLAPKQLSPSGELAGSVGLVAEPRTGEAAAWQACAADAACEVAVDLRSSRGVWGPAQTLGALDATDAPVLAAGPAGPAIVAWVAHGHVLAAVAAQHASRFGRPQTISRTSNAAQLALGFAPDGDALAVWTQGADRQALAGARFMHY